MTFRLWRVAALLFGSSACALVYQVAWFRELRLIFGASTASSAAVLAVFMGGLGVGGAILGKRADKSDNPLRLYAHLEILVAILAALSPLLVWLAQTAYLGIGGASTLGGTGATLLRLVLSVVVLGPSTFLMGGTLPSAARAVEREADLGRQRVATLYGVNTMGAVVGAVAANFLFLEVFGTRLTLWLACLVNLLVGFVARMISRDAKASAEADMDEDASDDAASAPEPVTSASPVGAGLRWFPPLAAAVAGFAFMMMELVWYRMLAPLLGGSSYTFGLILAVALVGIGIGSALYSRTKAPSTLSLFAITCTLEALAILVPYALGDRLAILALTLRHPAGYSFGAAVAVWSVVSAIVVLPAAIVSGFQFPAIIGLYGRGKDGVGRDVGNAYLANTIGSIVGSLSGGFGLLPLLSAPRCWVLVGVLLLATAALAISVDVGRRAAGARRDLGVVAVSGALSIAAILAHGPTAVWRHSGIGAGRSDDALSSGNAKVEIEKFKRTWLSTVRWEEDGLESTVAIGQSGGFAFIVNGKSDGHTLIDSPTQVMSGLVASLIHPDPKSTMVIGLGTGSTAGWLASVPSMDRVDVVELEPSILRVARDCAPVNQNVLDNPKIHIHLGDAREVLRTTRERYDIVFSEPSNPYRAGISSMYTVEYYRAASERLKPGGMFVQWLQAYEVDGWVVSTVITTLRQVFPSVMLWRTTTGDLLAIAEPDPKAIDIARLRKRVAEEPYATALRATWETATAEGVLAHHIGTTKLTDEILDSRLGAVNTDDQNFLEFAYARGVGVHGHVDDVLEQISTRMRLSAPLIHGTIDPNLVASERFVRKLVEGAPIDAESTNAVGALGPLLRKLPTEDPKVTLAAWRALGRPPQTYIELEAIARTASYAGDPEAEALVSGLNSVAQRKALHTVALLQRKKRAEAADMLEQAFVAMQTDPWIPGSDVTVALNVATRLAAKDPAVARRFVDVLAKPFAVEASRTTRLRTRIGLARSASDPALCVRAFDDMVVTPFERPMLELRVRCLRDAGDPRLAEAEDDLLDLLAATEPFGALGKNAPPPPVPPPVPKAARADAGGASAIPDAAASATPVQDASTTPSEP